MAGVESYDGENKKSTSSSREKRMIKSTSSQPDVEPDVFVMRHITEKIEKQ